jgi:hypothetical protein
MNLFRKLNSKLKHALVNAGVFGRETTYEVIKVERLARPSLDFTYKYKVTLKRSREFIGEDTVEYVGSSNFYRLPNFQSTPNYQLDMLLMSAVRKYEFENPECIGIKHR